MTEFVQNIHIIANMKESSFAKRLVNDDLTLTKISKKQQFSSEFKSFLHLDRSASLEKVVSKLKQAVQLTVKLLPTHIEDIERDEKFGGDFTIFFQRLYSRYSDLRSKISHIVDLNDDFKKLQTVALDLFSKKMEAKKYLVFVHDFYQKNWLDVPSLRVPSSFFKNQIESRLETAPEPVGQENVYERIEILKQAFILSHQVPNNISLQSTLSTFFNSTMISVYWNGISAEKWSFLLADLSEEETKYYISKALDAVIKDWDNFLPYFEKFYENVIEKEIKRLNSFYNEIMSYFYTPNIKEKFLTYRNSLLTFYVNGLESHCVLPTSTVQELFQTLEPIFLEDLIDTNPAAFFKKPCIESRKGKLEFTPLFGSLISAVVQDSNLFLQKLFVHSSMFSHETCTQVLEMMVDPSNLSQHTGFIANFLVSVPSPSFAVGSIIAIIPQLDATFFQKILDEILLLSNLWKDNLIPFASCLKKLTSKCKKDQQDKLSDIIKELLENEIQRLDGLYKTRKDLFSEEEAKKYYLGYRNSLLIHYVNGLESRALPSQQTLISLFHTMEHHVVLENLLDTNPSAFFEKSPLEIQDGKLEFTSVFKLFFRSVIQDPDLFLRKLLHHSSIFSTFIYNQIIDMMADPDFIVQYPSFMAHSFAIADLKHSAIDLMMKILTERDEASFQNILGQSLFFSDLSEEDLLQFVFRLKRLMSECRRLNRNDLLTHCNSFFVHLMPLYFHAMNTGTLANPNWVPLLRRKSVLNAPIMEIHDSSLKTIFLSFDREVIQQINSSFSFEFDCKKFPLLTAETLGLLLSLFPNLNFLNAYNEKHLSDVVVIANNEMLYVNKAILSSIQYFNILFNQSFLEKAHIESKENDPSALLEIEVDVPSSDSPKSIIRTTNASTDSPKVMVRKKKDSTESNKILSLFGFLSRWLPVIYNSSRNIPKELSSIELLADMEMALALQSTQLMKIIDGLLSISYFREKNPEEITLNEILIKEKIPQNLVYEELLRDRETASTLHAEQLVTTIDILLPLGYFKDRIPQKPDLKAVFSDLKMAITLNSKKLIDELDNLLCICMNNHPDTFERKMHEFFNLKQGMPWDQVRKETELFSGRSFYMLFSIHMCAKEADLKRDI